MPPRFDGVPVSSSEPPATVRKPRFAGMPVAPTPAAAPRSQEVITAPSGLKPGTREYADWAATQARAGKKLPQISDPNPEPAWGAPGVLAPVQFQEGTGNARLAVPSVITDLLPALAAPGRALQGGYDQLRVEPETGAVEPFDTRMMDDSASLAAAVVPTSAAARLAAPAVKAGSAAADVLTVAGPTSRIPAAKVAASAVPEIDELYAAKNAAYEAVDKLGARYSTEAYDQLTSDMLKRAADGAISESRHPKAYSMLVDLQSNPKALSLTELDQMRQVIRRDLVNAGDDAEGHFGQEFISAIDSFIEKAGPGQITGATPEAANKTIKAARLAHRIVKKSEILQDALDKAQRRTASTGSGGNIDNATRQALARIVGSPKLSASFTKAEIGMMDEVINRGGKLGDVVRLIGKLSPSGNGLMAALGLGATAMNPVMAAAPAVGMVARSISDRATQKGVERLTEAVRTGGVPRVPVAPPAPNVPSSLTPKASTTLIEQNFGQRAPILSSPTGLFRLNT